MHYRQLGQTGLSVSALGFGCGAVGGLLVRGDRQEMRRVVAYAIERGITYFDTAASYGDGQSETNLGWLLQELKPEVVVGTKVALKAEAFGSIKAAITQSVANSLRRLQMERVDLIQLHNPVTTQPQPGRNWMTLAQVDEAMAAFEDLQAQGKLRFWGMTGLGDTSALHQALGSSAQTIQSCYNLLNPSAGQTVPAGFPFQDYDHLIDKANAKHMGVIAIRVLAAGALSGSANRHPNAAQNVAPIATGSNFEEDLAQAQRFQFLVDEGYASTLVEAAIRFVISNDKVSTALVGISNMAQFEEALDAAEKGPLPAATLARLSGISQ